MVIAEPPVARRSIAPFTSLSETVRFSSLASASAACTVFVGECLPAPHDPTEVVERQPLGVIEQRVEHLADLDATPAIAAGPGEFVDLGRTDVSGEQRIADHGMLVEQADHLLHRGGLWARPVEVRPQPPGHAQVAVLAMDATGGGHRHHRSDLGVDAPPLQLEFAEPGRDVTVVEGLNLVDKGGEHDITHSKHQY